MCHETPLEDDAEWTGWETFAVLVILPLSILLGAVVAEVIFP